MTDYKKIVNSANEHVETLMVKYQTIQHLLNNKQCNKIEKGYKRSRQGFDDNWLGAIFDGIGQIEDTLNQIDPLKELGIPVHSHIRTPSYYIKH